MLFELDNDFTFDSDRMIVFPTSSTLKIRELCEEYFPNSDPYFIDKKGLLESKKGQKSLRNKIIKGAGIILTFKCALRCTYCSQSSVDESGYHLTLNEIKVFIKEVLKKRIIASLALHESPLLEVYFTGGGEPTYDWQLFTETVLWITEECRKNHINLRMGMTTNGWLSDSQCDFIKQHFNSVMVSYDGVPEVQNKNRRNSTGKSINDRVIKTINDLSQSNLRVTVRTTIWQDDIKMLAEMYEYMAKVVPNIDVWDINPVTYDGRALNTENKEKIYEAPNFVDAFLRVEKKAQVDEVHFQITSALMESSMTSFSCGGVGNNVVSEWLLPNRKIITCSDSSNMATVIGEIVQDEVIFYDAYKDPLLDQAIISLDECHRCVAYRICGGGCPLKHLREAVFKSKTLFWECETIRYLWKMIMDKVIMEGEFRGWTLQEPLNCELKEAGVRILAEKGKSCL